jgi:ABC-type transport system involved in multi-copper enzyme maturation permease subunit
MIPSMENSRSNAVHPVLIIGRGVFIEILRRKDIYLLLILAFIFFIGIFVMNLVGIENSATATFLLNLGLSIACFLAHILTLLCASRQIPSELNNGTIYPLLAKPVRRSQFYIGKWFAVSLTGFLTLLILLIIGWVPVPKMQSFSSLLLLQGIVLLGVSICLLAALSLLFSLIFPKGVNIVLLALLVFLGSKFINFIRMQSLDSSFSGIVKWCTAYIPDFSLLNLITRYTDGIGPLKFLEFSALFLYGSVFTAVSLFVGIAIFRKRSL